MTKSIALIGVFVIAFAVARLVSSPEDHPVEEEAQRKQPLSAIGGHPHSHSPSPSGAGFKAAVDRLAYVDKAMQAGAHRSLLDGGKHNDVALKIALDWAAKDPAGLWEWIESRGEDEIPFYQIQVVDEIFRHWFEKDPELALATLRRADRDQKRVGSAAIIGLIFADDPALAASAQAQLEELVSLDPHHQGYAIRPGQEELERLRNLGYAGDG